MSSPPKSDLKAGHAPAVKAGGMRIATKRSGGSSQAADTGAVAAAEVEEAVSAPPAPEDGGPLIISGVAVQGNKDFPKEAIQAYHVKPEPSLEKRPPATKGSSSIPHHIQQPGRRQ